ncbi:MAG: site-specific DNA-methyltransferase [Fimbriimonadaceae bacterium]|nr:site-specific DNA-methyltransferase [Fimbriimonadaceae bacterium]QOJ11370.1 MAG: site-specific DNA-methyltransferase [Chthonomonadaceae bacterium]
MSRLRWIVGDSRHLADLESNSIHLIVTSPPYWQIKDYGHASQVGFSESYESFINNLNLVWSECERVLHPGCRLCVNVGDQFARAAAYGRYKLISLQSEVIRCCENLGMDYMGTIIWRKVTSMRTTGGAVIMGSYPRPRNGMIKVDFEYILLFKKLGQPPAVSQDQKAAATLTAAEWNTFFAGHWSIPGEKGSSHPAAFPVEVPARLIRMFSFPGETALDPFAGSGTTLKAASEWGRFAVGYDIHPGFAEVARSRLPEIDVVESPPLDPEFVARKLEGLPYPFRDPHGFDRRRSPDEVEQLMRSR